ncbi:MAG: molybdate ABC transporter substrate-binding protein [Alphaproteobacteria bacterium]|nr:molybdate ABC transporter substrate-binding protein [Alphaproteobacteria bacterium]
MRHLGIRAAFIVGLSALMVLGLGSRARAQQPDVGPTITIAAANSTCDAIARVGELFKARHGGAFAFICKASGRLAKGLIGSSIEADVFISANRKWMDTMIEAGLIDAATVSSLWGNGLVVAAPSAHAQALGRLDDLAAPAVRQIMIGDPSTAPFGRYSKQALENAGVWDAVRPKVVTRKHITLLAENLAAAGPGTYGMLFSTNVSEGLSAVLDVPADLHEPARYFSAPLKAAADRTDVHAFVRFMAEPEALKAFTDLGFKTD